METQSHGFKYEKDVIERYNLYKVEDYTNPFDAYDEDNNKYQIKTIKKGSSIDLGDYFRNSEKEENFYLIVSFWEDKKENIVEEYLFLIDCNSWKELLSFSLKEEMKDWITNKVSNSKEYDEVWKREVKYFKNRFENEKDRKIKLRFKRDHKSQRRIQCAINSNDLEYLKENFLVGKQI